MTVSKVDASPIKASSGAELISAERKRQMEIEGWTPEHDDQHQYGELILAARCYIESKSGQFNFNKRMWPWDSKWWKPKDRISNLVRAGALIASEIDRLQRSSSYILTEKEADKLNYTMVSLGNPTTFEGFIQDNFISLVVTERSKSEHPRLTRFYASIKNCEIKDGAFLVSIMGEGNDPESCIKDLADSLLGNTIVKNAYGNRKEIQVPNEWKLVD